MDSAPLAEGKQMTYFAPEIIRRNIMHSIGPVLDKADALLDHYLADAPREVWEPIADDLNPGRAERIDFFVAYLSPDCPGCNP